LDFKIEFPAANTISNDNRFDLNSPFNFEVLQKSIKNFGFIHPLIAWRNENKIILVDGFKRLKIAKKLNKNELPFTFLSDQYSLPNVVDFRYENLCLNSIEMNIFQKAGLFNIIKNGNCTDDILFKWQQKLNFFWSGKIEKILSWPAEARNYVYKYNLSLKQINLLLGFENDIIREIIHFADLLSLRIVELNKVLEMIIEIAINENNSINQILNSDKILSVLNNEKFNRNQKISEIKKLLYNWRYPLISKYQNQLNNKIKSLSLSHNIKLNYDDTFEKSEILLTARLKNIHDIHNILKDLSNESNINVFKEVFDII
jgi:hypothetical protein